MFIRVFVFVVFVAACAATALAQPASAQAPSDGVWKGTGLQVGAGAAQSTWTIRFTVNQHGKNELEYPRLGCKGKQTQIANAVEGFADTDRITYGPCIDRGRI